MFSFKPASSPSSFTFIKRLFSSSWLSAIRVVSSACLRLLIFLLVILIPACGSSNPAFHMMYSAYKLNNQGDNIQLWHPNLEPLCCSMFSSNYCFLTCIQTTHYLKTKIFFISLNFESSYKLPVLDWKSRKMEHFFCRLIALFTWKELNETKLLSHLLD